MKSGQGLRHEQADSAENCLLPHSLAHIELISYMVQVCALREGAVQSGRAVTKQENSSQTWTTGHCDLGTDNPPMKTASDEASLTIMPKKT